MGDRPRLILVSEDSHGAPQVEGLAALLPSVADALDAVVLRWKSGSARSIVVAARSLAQLAERPRLVLSDRFDLARAAGVEGVQLPEDGLDAQSVRAHWPEAMIGVSRHDESGVTDRSREADYVLLAPVFETASKPGQSGMGLVEFSRIANGSELPVVAMGGIDLERVSSVLQAGAAGVAVRSEVLTAPDPAQRVAELRAALDSAAASTPDDEFVSRPDRRIRPE